MTINFDKSPQNWPYKAAGDISLDTCFRSAMSTGTVNAVTKLLNAEARLGSGVGDSEEFKNATVQGGLRTGLAKLLNVQSREISLHGNTEDALRVVANRFPFQSGDKVLVYGGDYPSVYKPFAERRGLRCVFMQGEEDAQNRPVRWNLNEVESCLRNEKPRMIAISHVLYRSGFKADLKALAGLCASHDVLTVIDVAQSIGLEPLRPQELGVDAVAFPLWKGLNSPRGVAGLWTSSRLLADLKRHSLLPSYVHGIVSGTKVTNIDADDAKSLEPSTLPTADIAGASHAVSELLKYDPVAVKDEALKMQLLFASRISGKHATPVLEETERGGLILSFYLPKHHGQEQEVVNQARAKGVRITNRDGMVRVSPHYYTTADEIERAAKILNDILKA